MTMRTEERPAFVVTDGGVRVELGAQLGRGGQGAVYEDRSGHKAVKIIFDGSRARRERLRQQLLFLRRLDWQGLPVARPEETLRSHVGYLMKRLRGMKPLSALLAPEDPAGPSSLAAWYRETGGLARRLRLALSLSEAMAALHGRALCYGDLSPHNVFVSAAADACELRLIDGDNLRYEAIPAGEEVYTPRYGAPELHRAEGLCSTLTDLHPLAVLCHQLLRVQHPLLGDLVLDGEPELEERAFRGELPWIDDPADESNRSARGLPQELVLSPQLRVLFQECFGPGLRDPRRRPGAQRFCEVLRTALGAAIVCPACAWSYYYTLAACPDCEAPRPRLCRCELYLWDPRARPVPQMGGAPLVCGPDGKPRRVGLGLVTPGAPKVLDGMLLGDGSAGLRLTMQGEHLLIEPLDRRVRLLGGPAGPAAPLPEGGARILPGTAQFLHLSGDDAPHRVLIFSGPAADQTGGPHAR